MGVFSFSGGATCIVDGMFAFAVVANCLAVLKILCGCGSCKVTGSPSSNCSAFAADLFVFEGASELAGISSNLISGGLWFSGHAGQPQEAKDTGCKKNSRSNLCQASGCVTADSDEVLVQGSSEHGAVSSLPAGFEQASGRVDVPDGTMIEAAAASPGTSRFRPWNAGALGEVQSSGTKIQFFLSGIGRHTRNVRCEGSLSKAMYVMYTLQAPWWI